MNLFGIPTLLNKVAAVTNPISLVYADVQEVLGIFAPVQWGIFKDDEQVVVADSVIDFSYRKEARISTYPQQQGKFSSYNKVQMPYVIRIKMTRGGGTILSQRGGINIPFTASSGDANRLEFIGQLEAIQQSTELYSIRTPETTYDNINITGIDYRRDATRGATLLTMMVTGEEIMDTATIGFTTKKYGESEDPINLGTIQAKAISMKDKAVSSAQGGLSILWAR